MYHKENYRSSIRRSYSGCPEVITEKTMVLISLHVHASSPECRANLYTNIADTSFEYVAVLKYLGTTVTIISNKTYIYK
jgi:hypothetical protein